MFIKKCFTENRNEAILVCHGGTIGTILEIFYDDSNIMAIISRLRKKMEANPGSPKYIQTIKGIGYRFNKEV